MYILEQRLNAQHVGPMKSQQGKCVWLCCSFAVIPVHYVIFLTLLLLRAPQSLVTWPAHFSTRHSSRNFSQRNQSRYPHRRRSARSWRRWRTRPSCDSTRQVWTNYSISLSWASSASLSSREMRQTSCNARSPTSRTCATWCTRCLRSPP